MVKNNDKINSITATFRPVVSTPSTKSRNRDDNITIATLSTQDRAILTINLKSVFLE